MKITKEFQSQVIKQTRPETGDKQSFDRIVQSQTIKVRQQEIQQLMEEISRQGDKLARFRSFKDLAKFKRLIKGFLEETIGNGLDLKRSYQFNFDGQGQPLSIVKQVDEKLIELTEEMMNQEKRTVDLLGIIGEIKGMLVNLYT